MNIVVRNLICIGVFQVLLVSCGGSDPSFPNSSRAAPNHVAITCESPYEYRVPEGPEAGMPVAHIADKDVDSERIISMLSRMHCGGWQHQLHSALVMIEGDLVAEMYFPGFEGVDRNVVEYDKDRLHGLASVQKSVASAVFGIAHEQGYLDAENDTLYDYFSDYDEINWHDVYEIDGEEVRKSDITVLDLLHMAAGFEWDEGSAHYGDPTNSLRQMTNSGEGLAFALRRDMVAVPGETFVYNTALSNMLEEILVQATGQPIWDYAEENLFNPMGMEFHWWEYGLSLRPRGMAKIGEMYRNGGVFNGVQVVPEEWVAASLEPVFEVTPGARISGYGYQWWGSDFTIEGEIISAVAGLGYGGQQIYIFEDYEAVVVFTAAEFPGQYGNRATTYSWLNDYIVPALMFPDGQ